MKRVVLTILALIYFCPSAFNIATDVAPHKIQVLLKLIMWSSHVWAPEWLSKDMLFHFKDAISLLVGDEQSKVKTLVVKSLYESKQLLDFSKSPILNYFNK